MLYYDTCLRCDLIGLLVIVGCMSVGFALCIHKLFVVEDDKLCMYVCMYVCGEAACCLTMFTYLSHTALPLSAAAPPSTPHHSGPVGGGTAIPAMLSGAAPGSSNLQRSNSSSMTPK